MKLNKKATAVPSKGKSSEGTSDKSPPVTRGRPASQRKKFKKSLGPDFLDPLELGPVYSTKRSSAYASDLKANSSSPINSNVNIGSHSPASSSSSNLSTVTSSDKLNDDRRQPSGHSLLKCAKCRIEVSASTLGSPFAKLTSSQVSSALWTCLSCVTNGASSKCTYCNSNSAEFSCSKCQVARFHLRCLKSHTKSQGQLVCSSCRSSSSTAQSSNPSKTLSPSTVVKRDKSDHQVSSPATTDDSIQNGRKLVDGKDDSSEPTPAKRQRKIHSNTTETRLQETLDAPTATDADDVSEEKSQVVSQDAQVDQTIDDEPKADLITTTTTTQVKEEPTEDEPQPQPSEPQTVVSTETQEANDDNAAEDDEGDEEKMVVDESESQENDAPFEDADADADASKDAPSVNSLDQAKVDDTTTSELNYKETQISSQLTEASNLSQAKSEVSTESATTANCVDATASVASNSSSESTSSSINDESKANYRFRPPETWSVDEVEQFITSTGFPNESSTFKEQEIDGKSLLLLKRQDVLTGLGFKLGPALKLYSFIHHLQNFNLVTVLPTPPGSVIAESIVDQESNSITSSNVNAANCSSTTTTCTESMTTTTATASSNLATGSGNNESNGNFMTQNVDNLPSQDLTGENEMTDQKTIKSASGSAAEDAVDSTISSSSNVQNDNNNSSSTSTTTLKPCFVA